MTDSHQVIRQLPVYVPVTSDLWSSRRMVAWGDKDTLKLTELSCYQHGMVPALHRIAEITCQENHVMCKDTISLFVEHLFYW